MKPLLDVAFGYRQLRSGLPRPGLRSPFCVPDELKTPAHAPMPLYALGALKIPLSLGHRTVRSRTAATLVALALVACGALSQPTVVGVIESTAEIGGAACPLLLTGTDGARWEVTFDEPYTVSFDPDLRAVVSEGAIPIARTGDRIRIDVVGSRSEPSACRWGTPVVATKVGRAP